VKLNYFSSLFLIKIPCGLPHQGGDQGEIVCNANRLIFKLFYFVDVIDTAVKWIKNVVYNITFQ
jgi:hypothetical protein